MSLIKTLAKVAIGVAVARGVSGMLKQGQVRAAQQEGGLFGQRNTLGARPQGGGGIEDLLGAVMGGQGGSAGLGGMLERLGGAGTGNGLNGILGQLGAQGDGLGGLLDQLGGGSTSGGGGLGGMIGGLLGGAAAGTAASRGFGDLLNQAIAGQDEPGIQPSPDQEALAALMLRAMIQAMKSDGQIDAPEQERLLGRLGDVSEQERAFVQAEMQKPVDAAALAREVPRGLEQQIYAMSVMGIDLDSQPEAQYLHSLAQAMGLDAGAVNTVHAELGVPSLYT